jgi:hypothetical protein
MKVYIKNHEHGAGRWIYRGYVNAWRSLGYQVEYYNNLLDFDDEDYYLMSLDGDVTLNNIKILEKATKVFLFVQPVVFPKPWGQHPNFVTSLNKQQIDKINELKNVVKWTFVDTKMYDFYNEWGHDIETVHLAFDSFDYNPVKDSRYEFDVCYVGGWANNGFDEKRQIMTSHFMEIKNSGLKAGIFINQNISAQDEANLLYNSKVSINIHDKYQHLLGADVNERTFKSLGLNGFLISDKVEIMKNIFPNVPLVETPQDMVQTIKKYSNQNLEDIKKENRNMILENHTYVNRVKQMLEV